MKATLTRKGGK